MNRADLWIKSNNIDENYGKIKMVFKSFGLVEGKDFWKENGCIKFKKMWENCERVYKVTVDNLNKTLLVHLRDVKPDKDGNETYHVFKKKDGKPYLFGGFDPWVSCIKFLIR